MEKKRAVMVRYGMAWNRKHRDTGVEQRIFVRLEGDTEDGDVGALPSVFCRRRRSPKNQESSQYRHEIDTKHSHDTFEQPGDEPFLP